MKYYIFSLLILIANFSYKHLGFENNSSEVINNANKYHVDSDWKTFVWNKITPIVEETALNSLINCNKYFYVTSSSKRWSGAVNYSKIRPSNSPKTSNKEMFTAEENYNKSNLKEINVSSDTKYTVHIQGHYIFLGDKKYECTRELTFPGYSKYKLVFTNNHDGSSYLVFLASFSFVTGNITLFLDDESKITPIDKYLRGSYTKSTGVIKDYYSIYYLTPSDVNKIMNSNIAAICYNNVSETIFNFDCISYNGNYEKTVQFNSILRNLFN